MPAKKTKNRRGAKPALRLTRIFNAPRSLVFAAWTQPAHQRRWSAPHGFEISVGRGELRPGGPWRACMIAPDGEKLWVGGVYRKVVPNELLVFTHRWEDESEAPETVVTVRFADLPGGRTRMTFSQTGFDSAGSRDGHADGWSQCFERLKVLLAKQQKKPRS